MQEGKGVLFSANGYDIEFTPISNVQTEVQTANSVLIQQNDTKQVTYDKVFGANSSIEYEVVPSGIKENIVLQKYDGINRFSFKLTCGDLTPELQESGAILFKENSTEHGEERQDYISMSPIIVYDSSEEQVRDENTNVTLKKTAEGEYTYTIIVDKNYLTATERVYPVYVDPQVRVTSTYIEDSAIYSAHPSTNFNGNSSSPLGYYSGLGTVYVYTKINTNALQTMTDFNKDNITSAIYRMTRVNSVATGTITLNACKSDWDENTITYNDAPDVYTTAANTVSNVLAASSSTSVSFDITNLAKRWTGVLYNESAEANYGFRIQYQNQSQYTSYLIVDLSESTTAPPYLEIVHKPYEAKNLYNGGVYYIRNKNTGGYLNISQSTVAYSGMPLFSKEFFAGYAYLWKLEYSDGYYRLRAMNGNSSLLFVDYSYERVGIMSTDATGNSGYLWNIVKNVDNSYKILYRPQNSMGGIYEKVNAGGHEILLGELNSENSGWEFIPAFQNTGIYYLKNRQSGMYLGYDGSSNIRQFNKSTMGPNHIRWRVDITGEHNSVTLKNMYSDTYLSVLNNSTDNEAALGLTSSGTADASKWRIMYNEVPGATYSNVRVMSKLTSYAKGLTTKQASTSNGASVFQFEYNDNVTENDEWELVPAINLDVRFDDGYRKLKGFTDVISYELSSQMSVPIRVLNQVAGVELTMQTVPTLYTSYADKCDGRNENGLCTCGGTSQIVDKCSNLIFYDKEGQVLPGNGHHTNNYSIFNDFYSCFSLISDNTLFQLYSGYNTCVPQNHDDDEDNDTRIYGLGSVKGKHTCIYSYETRKSTPVHEFCHNFSALDHRMSNVVYNNCVMSHKRNDNQIYSSLTSSELHITSFMCNDCITALRLARHFVARVS